MAKINYKVGDYVVRKTDRRSSDWWRSNPGPFKVVSLGHDGGSALVGFDVPVGNIQVSHSWDADNFTKADAPAEKGEYILILKENGKLKPASVPRVYSTEAQAKAVAASMAEKNPGSEFLIYKAVGKAKTTAAVVEMF